MGTGFATICFSPQNLEGLNQAQKVTFSCTALNHPCCVYSACIPALCTPPPPDQLPLLASTAPTRFQYGIIPPTGLTHSPVAGRLQATFSYPISYNILLLNIYLLTFKGINVGCIFNRCNQNYCLFMTTKCPCPYISFMIYVS